MKVLRILRRRKIRLSFIFLLLLFFIFNTYAWMSTDKNTNMGTITTNVDKWSVAFIVNDDEEVKTEEYTFEIEEFYPGITDITKTIDVYNIGEASTYLKYEIADIYLYGEQIKLVPVEGKDGVYVPETMGEETTDEATQQTTASMFVKSDASIFDEENTNYSFYLRYPTPFSISYTYEKTHISGNDDSAMAKSWMTINLSWPNDENNNEEDTRLGNMVYEFENAKDENGNLINEGEPALRIVAKVTSARDLKELEEAQSELEAGAE